MGTAISVQKEAGCRSGRIRASAPKVAIVPSLLVAPLQSLILKPIPRMLPRALGPSTWSSVQRAWIRARPKMDKREPLVGVPWLRVQDSKL